MSSFPSLPPEINEKLQQIDFSSPPAVSPIQQEWDFLKEAETEFKKFMADKHIKTTKDLEYGPVLYLLHQLPQHYVNVLIHFGMPATTITKKDWDTWYKDIKDGPGVVAPDGTLYLEQCYAQLDPKWTEALFYYLLHRWLQWTDAKFGTHPRVMNVTGQQQLTIAIMGDWGTGLYNDNGYPSPSSLVGKAMAGLQPVPDITLHLGDVYYAGLEKEESDKLLASFPKGRLANFTLNSNHEMYDGARGYFYTALANPLFKPHQNETSYFAITFGNWVIVALDTAFYDKSTMYMDGALYDKDQLQFIKGLNISPSQKIILMTHHTGLTADGTQLTNPSYDGTGGKSPLFTQVLRAFNGRCPDYWYYGHIHNGIVYNEQSFAGKYKCPSGLSPRLRCVGHAAIPFGKGTGLFAGNKNIPGISYFAQTPVPPNSNPINPFLANRVLNGFAVITLTGSGISEQFYEVSPTTGMQKVWSS
ncbi:MAG: metallophosphoesterase [Chitinophagaceae bacterium]